MLVLMAAALAGLLFMLMRLQREDSRIRQEYAAAQTRAEGLDAQLQDEKKRVEHAEAIAKTARDSETEALQKSAKLQAELQAERDAGAEKIQLLRESRAEMERDFENLAQKILEKKGATFNETARQGNRRAGHPPDQRIGRIPPYRAEKIHTERTSESTDLSFGTISPISKRTRTRVAEDANNLTRALKGDKKALGVTGAKPLWSAFWKNPDSSAEANTRLSPPKSSARTEKRQHPDFKILLQEGAASHCGLQGVAGRLSRLCFRANRRRARKSAVRPCRRRPQSRAGSLAEKHYQRVRGMNSPDFVFMFMPIEAAWIVPCCWRRTELFDDSIQIAKL